MALRGTLKDFGIADILQLIGHQQKTGGLVVKNRDQEVQVFFHEGNVVRAESSTRNKRELLGRMLVRAEVLSEEQLTRALDEQKRTLKRLGQILVEGGSLDRKVLRTFMRLQTTETVYRLFLWDAGNYEFSQLDVELDPEGEPIRSESVLMEGFRQVDEWPAIRRKVQSYGVTFDKLQDLDTLVAANAGNDDMGLDDAFGEGGGGGGGGKPSASLKNIGQNERIIYQLITPERDVQKLIDLSRLGEFETCKALASLLEAQIIVLIRERKGSTPSAEATVGGISVGRTLRFLPLITRVVVSLALVIGAAVGVRSLGAAPQRWLGLRPAWGYLDLSIKSEVADAYLQRIERALGVYRALKGGYPQQLDDLVRLGLLSQRDLSFPWDTPYHYAVRNDRYELLRPLY
jgi:hypothetical protein